MATTMSSVDVALNEAMEIDGASAAMIVDYDSGMALGTAGGGIDLDVAAAGNTEVVRAKMNTMAELGLNDAIEDILITLTNQFHLIKLAGNKFIYLVVNSRETNLAIAREVLRNTAANLN